MDLFLANAYAMGVKLAKVLCRDGQEWRARDEVMAAMDAAVTEGLSSISIEVLADPTEHSQLVACLRLLGYAVHPIGDGKQLDVSVTAIGPGELVRL